MREALQPRRPVGAHDAVLERGGGKLQAGRAQRRDRGAGIVELVAAGQARRRQVDEAVLVLIDQAAALLARHPMLAGGLDRGAEPRGRVLDHAQRLARLRRDHRRHAALEDAGLLGGDRGERVAQEIDVVDRDRRDHGRERMRDHVGGVEPPAEADLHQHHVGRMAREQHERGRGGDLEHRDGGALVDALAFGEHLGKLGVRHQRAAARPAEAEALVEAHEMRRGIDVHGKARRLQDRAHERDGRAFAVGAGHVDHGRQLEFGVPEALQQPLDAVERQVDALGMQRKQPREDRVDGSGHAPAGTGNAGGATCPAPAGAFIRRRHRLARTARNWWRCTTMSTMPWSLRYSAR